MEKRQKEDWNENQLEGRNAVLEALRSGRDMEKLLVQKGNVEGTIRRIVAQAKEKGVVIQETSRQKLDELSQTKNHQGVIALVSAHHYTELEDILAAAREKGEDPFLLLLDGITDPHNLGAILRTAECAGVHGVVIPKRRSVGLNATVGKTSAGAVEYVPVARVTNIVKTMEYLKKEGLWIACADMDGLDQYERANCACDWQRRRWCKPSGAGKLRLYGVNPDVRENFLAECFGCCGTADV